MVNCDNCGVCCTKPFIRNNDKSYAFTGTVHEQTVRFCKHFDCEALKCKIYNERPPVCRDYPIGGKECLLKRTLFNLKL